MKKVFVLGIILAAAGTAGCTWIAMKLHHKKQPYAAEPFYRKYLVAGNKLDDQIVEEERRVQAQPDDPNRERHQADDREKPRTPPTPEHDRRQCDDRLETNRRPGGPCLTKEQGDQLKAHAPGRQVTTKLALPTDQPDG